MSEIETIEILDGIIVDVFQWCVTQFGPTWGAIAWLIVLGIIVGVLTPVPSTIDYRFRK